VLSGEREARVIFAAMRRRLRSEDETVLGVDLGGGSLELIAGDDDGVHWEATLPLGVARLHSEFVAHDPMRSDEADRIRARVRELVAPFRAKIEQIEPVRAIASGGTIGALVRRLQARRDEAARRSLRGSRVGPADLEALVEELVPSSHAERLALRGIEEARADLLPSGALVLRALADTLALPGYTYSDWGLREGILLETVGLESPAPGPEELL
jgi:exopolyphosphatase/guanosine-5'-triphosphate,3'-diphosphate pyrophosphatase